jgi:hypothetical protein
MNGFGACRPSHDLCKPPVAHVIRETSYVKVGKVGGGKCDRVRRPRAKSFEGVWNRKWTLKPAGRKVCRWRGEAGEFQKNNCRWLNSLLFPPAFAQPHRAERPLAFTGKDLTVALLFSSPLPPGTSRPPQLSNSHKGSGRLTARTHHAIWINFFMTCLFDQGY